MAPWLFFLFVGILDAGFYSYSFITTANAARIAALQTSTDVSNATNASLACSVAMSEMQSLVNVYGQMSCASGSVSKAAPVAVAVTCTDNTKGGACTGSCDGDDCVTSVTVTYLTVPLVPIPGILPLQMTINRTAQVRVGS